MRRDENNDDERELIFQRLGSPFFHYQQNKARTSGGSGASPLFGTDDSLSGLRWHRHGARYWGSIFGDDNFFSGSCEFRRLRQFLPGVMTINDLHRRHWGNREASCDLREMNPKRVRRSHSR
jgi:hypothetical protein